MRTIELRVTEEGKTPFGFTVATNTMDDIKLMNKIRKSLAIQVDADVIVKTGVNFKYAIGDTIWIKEMECEAKILSLWYSKTGIRYQCRWAAEGKYNEEYLFENEILDKKP